MVDSSYTAAMNRARSRRAAARRAVSEVSASSASSMPTSLPTRTSPRRDSTASTSSATETNEETVATKKEAEKETEEKMDKKDDGDENDTIEDKKGSASSASAAAAAAAGSSSSSSTEKKNLQKDDEETTERKNLASANNEEDSPNRKNTIENQPPSSISAAANDNDMSKEPSAASKKEEQNGDAPTSDSDDDDDDTLLCALATRETKKGNHTSPKKKKADKKSNALQNKEKVATKMEEKEKVTEEEEASNPKKQATSVSSPSSPQSPAKRIASNATKEKEPISKKEKEGKNLSSMMTKEELLALKREVKPSTKKTKLNGTDDVQAGATKAAKAEEKKTASEGDSNSKKETTAKNKSLSLVEDLTAMSESSISGKKNKESKSSSSGKKNNPTVSFSSPIVEKNESPTKIGKVEKENDDGHNEKYKSTETKETPKNRKRRSWAGGGESDTKSHFSSFHASNDESADKKASSPSSPASSPSNRKRRMSAVNAVAAATIATTTGRQHHYHHQQRRSAAEDATQVLGRKRSRTASAPSLEKEMQNLSKEDDLSHKRVRATSPSSKPKNCRGAKINNAIDFSATKSDNDDNTETTKKTPQQQQQTCKRSISMQFSSSSVSFHNASLIDINKLPKLKAWEVVWPKSDKNYSSDAVKVANMALSNKNYQCNNRGVEKAVAVTGLSPPPITVFSSVLNDNNRIHASERRKRPRTDGNKDTYINQHNSSTNSSMNRSIMDLKMELYLQGVKVHRGKGAEKLFANYWDALARFVSNTNNQNEEKYRKNRSCTDRSCNGIEATLDTFLKTRAMRRLHNQLILGLMKDCLQTTVPAETFHHHIPHQWKNKVMKKTLKIDPQKDDKKVETSPKKKNAVLPQSIVPTQIIQNNRIKHMVFREELDADERDMKRWMNNYGVYSGVWTFCGNDGVISPTLPLSTNRLTLSTNNTVENDVTVKVEKKVLPSARVPGAIEVDPLVRKLTNREGLNVSESAIWFLVVAVREHAVSVLKHAISNIEAVDSGEVILPELSSSFSQPVYIGSHQSDLGGKNSDSKEDLGNRSTADSSQPDDAATRKKKRRIISSLDLADVISSRPMLGGGSIGCSASRFAWERCISSAGSKTVFAVPSGLKAMQAAINREIETAASKRRLSVPDSADNIIIDVPKTADKSEESTPSSVPKKEEKTTVEDPQTKKKDGKKPAEAKDNSLAKTDDKKSSATRVSPAVAATKKFARGLGRGTKNLSALKARAAASQSTDKKDDSAGPKTKNGEKSSIEKASDSTNATKPTPKNPQQKEKGGSGDAGGRVAGGRGASGRGAGGRGASGRGAGGRGAGGRGAGGRGFGGRGIGKNLAMMRARSTQSQSKTESKPTNDKAPASAQESSEDKKSVEGKKKDDFLEGKKLALSRKVDQQRKSDGSNNNSTNATKRESETKSDASNATPDIGSFVPTVLTSKKADKNGSQDTILIPPLSVPEAQNKQS